MRCFIVLCCFSFTTPAIAQDAVLRFIEFRDGSVMRLPIEDEAWRVTIIRANGQIEQSAVQLAQLGNMIFTRAKGFERKQTMLSAVRRLGADDFHDRERAQAELLKLGSGARGDLESCLVLCSDSEARVRLTAILRSLPRGPEAQPAGAVFDRFTLGDECWGHLGDDGVPVRVDGKLVRLSREHIVGVSQLAPPYLWIGDNRPAGVFERVAIGDFPAGSVEEPFERGGAGQPLQSGQNIEREFIDKGFVLSTSTVSSFVSVNTFRVGGKSGGLSAATHQPQWEGAVSVRFIEPGREQTPAGVHYFGCNIAAVVPNGTLLVAFDRHGRELGRIATQTHGNDFLGVRSSTPMHRIEIVPQPQLDRDFTLDDFLFSPPRDPDSRLADKFIALSTDGSRIGCKDVSFAAGGIRLIGMPGELPDTTVPTNQLRRILFPGTTPSEASAGVIAELPDGSLLLGKLDGEHGQPNFSRLSALTEKAVRGLWSSARPPGEAAPAAQQSHIWDAASNRWQEITDVRFLEEIVIWKRNGTFEAAPYHRLPPVHLGGERPMPSRWRLATEDGDELAVQLADDWRGRLSSGLTVNWQGRPLHLTRSEIRFLQAAP